MLFIMIRGPESRRIALEPSLFFLIFFDPSHTWYSFFSVRFLSRLVIFYLTFGNFINSVLKLTVLSLENQNITRVLSFLF